jgi:SAM-dependent methyltransferase
MPGKSRDAYLQPYRQAHGLHGNDFGVTLWANPASQQRRFEILADMVDHTGKIVLDAGCSRGDFATFLLQREQPYHRFIGIDGLDQVIDHARQRDLPRAEFHCRDFVTYPQAMAMGEPDIVSISGSLNTMDKRTVMAVLEAAWQAPRETLAFNFLSDRTGPGALPQKYPARRLPTVELIDWAMSKTWAVQFRQDYFNHGHDATIVMDKVGDHENR